MPYYFKEAYSVSFGFCVFSLVCMSLCYVATINDRFCTKCARNFFLTYLIEIMKMLKETHNSSLHVVYSNKVTTSRHVNIVLSKVNAFKAKKSINLLAKIFFSNMFYIIAVHCRIVNFLALIPWNEWFCYVQ